jgi:hypothetical protein
LQLLYCLAFLIGYGRMQLFMSVDE